ncbi:hypothetical protein V5799_012150 [Amblyomma americanum]|uniref:Uncharacterized protein n=1 Tax=Amblyomma americanum TaxID=6943 RepID=A0AAQ4EEW2_AMBAM
MQTTAPTPFAHGKQACGSVPGFALTKIATESCVVRPPRAELKTTWPQYSGLAWSRHGRHQPPSPSYRCVGTKDPIQLTADFSGKFAGFTSQLASPNDKA